MTPNRIRIFWLLVVALASWLAVTHIRISSELEDFMPAGEAADRALVEQMRAGAGARLMLIGLDNAAPERLAELSAQLTAKLTAGGLFRRVINGPLAIDPVEQARVFEYRYLLAPTARDDFTPASLRAALEARLADLASPFTLDRASIPSDPTGATRAAQEAWQRQQGPLLRFGVWFARDGDRALLLAETRAEGFDLDGQEQAQEAVRAAFAELQPGAARLVATGGGVFAVESRALIRSESQWASTLASIAMALLIYSGYRSKRAVVIAALPLFFAVSTATVATGLMFGSIHGITLAFGITLIGVAGDYPLHLLSHMDRHTTPMQALHKVWPTIRIGVLTTSAGYLAMATTDFTGVAQLGTFAIAGILSAAAFTRWAMPHFVPATLEPRLGRELKVPHLPVAAGLALGAVILLLLWWRPPVWEEDLAALSPLPQELLKQDGTLRSAVGAPEVGHVVVIRGPDAETVLQRCEILGQELAVPVAQGWLGGWDGACRYLPSARLQRERQEALPQHATLDADLARASRGLPFRPGVFQPFIDGVDHSRQLVPLLPADLAGTARGSQVEAMLSERDGEWAGFMTLTGVHDGAPLDRFFTPHAEWASYMNTKERANQVLHRFRVEALERLAWGAALVLTLLAVNLRSVNHALRSLLPVALALGVDLVALRLLGERLSLFHLVALLLVVGICIDYTLFFEKSKSDPHAERATHHAVNLCSISTIGAFGILAASQIPVLRAIGLTAAIGIGASYWLARTLAPAPRQQ